MTLGPHIMNLVSLCPKTAKIECRKISTNQIAGIIHCSIKPGIYVMCPGVVRLHTKFQNSSFNTWFLMNFFLSTNQIAVFSHVMNWIMGHYEHAHLLMTTNTHVKFDTDRTNSHWDPGWTTSSGKKKKNNNNNSEETCE